MKMKRSLFLSLSLLFSIGVQAQSSPSMDGANQAIINTCKAEGGTFISYKDDKCEYSGCAYVGKNGDVSYDGDNQRVVGGCNLAEYQKKAKAAYKDEIDKKIRELEEQKRQADRIGKKPGDGSVEVGDLNGDGVIDDKDRAIAEERIRNGGGTPAGAGGGTPAGAGGAGGAGGATTVGGKPAGAGGAGGIGPGGVRVQGANGEILYCQTEDGQVEIGLDHACHDACKSRRSFLGIIGRKKADLERKSCIECMIGQGHRFSKEVMAKAGVRTITVKGGVGSNWVCRDAQGNIVSSVTVGVGGAVNCSGTQPGVSTTTSGPHVVVSGPSTTGTTTNGGPQVVVNGPASTTVSATLPAFCYSSKNKDIKACKEWMLNNRRFACSAGSTVTGCGVSDHMHDVDVRYSGDCINCGNKRDNSWIGDAAAGLFIGAGNALGAYFSGRAYQKGQEAWAGAAVKTAEQCTLNNANYLQYTVDQQLPAVTPDQQAAMGCNGYNLGQYAGMGNYGGGAWGAGGYSPGFIGGMIGPYGGYNPYGMGGMVGGAVAGIGMAGGYNAGMVGGYMQGGYVQGMAGGYIQGGYVQGMAGGLNAGMVGGYIQGGGFNAGMVGGYMQGGYVQGMAGGYMQGGYVQGMAGGYIQGGYAQGGYVQGYNGGLAGGFVNGISLAGGMASGYNSGYTGGGYINGGGIAGGYYPGMNGGVYNPWGSGLNQGMQGNYWMASQQTSNYDRMLQNQGISYQMGMNQGAGAYGGGFYGGSAGFNPMNAGFNINANIYGI